MIIQYGTMGTGATTAIVPNPPIDAPKTHYRIVVPCTIVCTLDSSPPEERAARVNLGDKAVDLPGWALCALTNRTVSLDQLGDLNPGESYDPLRDGEPISLDNDGDTIVIIDDQGNVIDTVTYGPVGVDEWVTTGLGCPVGEVGV